MPPIRILLRAPAHEKGKFAILTGQRRYLAHKQLNKAQSSDTA